MPRVGHGGPGGGVPFGEGSDEAGKFLKEAFLPSSNPAVPVTLCPHPAVFPSHRRVLYLSTP